MSPRLAPLAGLLLASASAPALAQDAAPPAGSAFEELDRASRSIVERCGPAVVRIEADRALPLRAVAADPAARRQVEEVLRVEGARECVTATGFLVDEEGLVLTTAAAAGGDACSLRVLFPGRGERAATVVGEDALAGVALVRVGPVEGVRALALASGEPAPGAVTLLLAPTARHGPLLQLGFVTEPRRAFGLYDAWLVSSVPVQAGHAGAPLLDARGAVLGLAVAAREERPGIEAGGQNLREYLEVRARTERRAAFSTFVPAAELRRIVQDLRERGRVRRGMAGVILGSAEPVIVEVGAGTPAEAAGLAAGDRVLAVDGVPVESGAQFGGFMRRRAPGTPVRVRVLSPGGRERETAIVLGELPAPPARRPALFNGLGVSSPAAPLLPAARLPEGADPAAKWLAVASVAPGSAAEAAGIRSGDWIVAIEETPVPSEEEYVRLVAGTLGGETRVRVRLFRPGEEATRVVVLKAEGAPR